MTSKPPDHSTRSLIARRDVTSSSQTSSKNFHPLPFQSRLWSISWFCSIPANVFSPELLWKHFPDSHTLNHLSDLRAEMGGNLLLSLSHEYMYSSSSLHRCSSDSNTRSCVSSTFCCISSWTLSSLFLLPWLCGVVWKLSWVWFWHHHQFSYLQSLLLVYQRLRFLFLSFPCIFWSRCFTFLSRVLSISPGHGKSLSISREISDSPTCPESFVFRSRWESAVSWLSSVNLTMITLRSSSL